MVVNRAGEGDKCKQQVFVNGKGVKDKFDTSCAFNKNTVSTSKRLMVYDSPDAGFSLFTDKPSTLVVVQGGKCSKRSYQKGKPSSASPEITDKECKAVKNKIKKEVKKIRNQKSKKNGDKKGDKKDKKKDKKSKDEKEN